MDILSDPRLQGVGAIAGIASVVGLFLFARRKRLAWGYTRLPVVQTANKVKDDLSVQYQGVPIDSAWVVSLTVVNTGSSSIARADFDSPLEIRFSEPGRILTWALEASQPSELPVEVISDDPDAQPAAAIRIAPLLMNPRDGFKLTLVVSGVVAEPQPHVSARISGVSTMADFDGDTWPLHLRLAQSLVSTAIVLAAMYATLVLVPINIRQWGAVILGALFATAVFFIMHGLVVLLFYRRFDPYRRLRN